MFAVVLIGLAVSLLLVGALLAACFLDVAFGGPRPALRPAGGGLELDQELALAWRLPFLAGDELTEWATAAARTTVRRGLSQPRTPATAGAIAGRIFSGLKRIAVASGDGRCSSEESCSNRPHGAIGVTPLEALAIVDAVCCFRPADVSRVRAAAIAASRKAPTAGAGSACTCPLLRQGDNCAADGLRPLDCRQNSLCPSIAQQPATGAAAEFAGSLVRGVEQGLSRELAEHGLDGARYELNSALATAFKPGAAAEWISGKPVFASCTRV